MWNNAQEVICISSLLHVTESMTFNKDKTII